MFVQCVMVTEGRTKIVPIALESLEAQSHSGHLTMCVPLDEQNEYFDIARFVRPVVFSDWEGSVPDTLHYGVEWRGGTISTVWDDDDYSPPDRLERTVSAIKTFHPRPVVCSYDRGWFVNIRTLEGSLVKLDHLWGGCLAFNRAAFFAGKGFKGRSCPGYDREFVEEAKDNGAMVLKIVAPDDRLPVAFIHNKNIATYARGDQVPMEDRLQEWMPSKVFQEVKKFQQFCIDRRVFP